MPSNNKILSSVSESLNLTFQKKECMAYGVHRNYTMFMQGSDFFARQQYILLSFCVERQQEPIIQTQLNFALPRGSRIYTDNFRIKIYVLVKRSLKYNVRSLIEIVQSITHFFENEGYMNCDERGVEGPTKVYRLKGECVFLNGESADIVQDMIKKDEIADSMKEERFLPGILGAFLGAFVGSILVLVVARLGYVSSLISALMGTAVVLGYKWKGVKLSKVSSLLCIFIEAIFAYMTFRLDMALSIYKAVNSTMPVLSFGQCFMNAKEIMSMVDSLSVYYENMALMMGIGIVVVIVTVVIELSAQKKQYQVYY
ncbi:MAG: hypothetical protein J6K58_05490 [Lachnospiraceae bacterium]|nr:hypothetical protein [Lachnospiraceae bacterium]